MQTEKLISDIEAQDAKTLQITIKTQQDTVKSYETMIKTLVEQLQNGIPVTAADHNMRVKQRDIVQEGQQAIDEGANSEQTASIIQDAVNQEIAQEQQSEGARRLTIESPSASIGQDDLNG